MQCWACGSQMVEGEKFCIKCGSDQTLREQYCIFCGAKLRGSAQFCSQCGKKQISAEDSNSPKWLSLAKNKKIWMMLALLIVVIVIVVIFVAAMPKNAIVGVWMCGTNKITFTNDGNFKISDGTYGTYTVDDHNELEMQCGEYSYQSGKWEYRYGSSAKENRNFWYIEGRKLYFRGKVYTKQ